MNDSQVEILLATFNGESYLPELLKSLDDQSENPFHITARDDGSTDKTAAILKEYAASHTETCKVLEDNKPSGSARANFGHLLREATGRYVMFADQDDLWQPEKIARTRLRMEAMEHQYGADTPLLVHTDLKVVDERLDIISESFWRFQNLDPSCGTTLNRILVQNVITGCTTMINRPLLELAGEIPDEAIMHDWWLALVAAAFGKIGWLSDATILYRQHGGNDTGATRWGGRLFAETALLGIQSDSLSQRIGKTRKQAELFLNHFDGRLAENQKRLVKAWATCGEQSLVERRLRILRHGFWKIGLLRNLGLLWAV